MKLIISRRILHLVLFWSVGFSNSKMAYFDNGHFFCPINLANVDTLLATVRWKKPLHVWRWK